MLVRAKPKAIRVRLTKGKTEISAFAEDGQEALCEAINLLSMQKELQPGNRLTVEEEGKR